MEGLDKDGGISFGRKPKSNKEKPVEQTKQERRNDIQDIAKMERLNAKLSQAKRIQGGGFAINGGAIVGALFYIDSILLDPSTVETLDIINKLANTDIDFENIIAKIQGYKAQIIGMAVSSQTMIMGYKDVVQKMRDRNDESFYQVLNDELKKIGV